MKSIQLKESNLTYDIYEKYATIVQKKHSSALAKKDGQNNINWYHGTMHHKIAALYKKDGKLIFEM